MPPQEDRTCPLNNGRLTIKGVEKMADLKKYVLVRASKKTGKVDMQLEGLGKAMLTIWAMQNTPKNKMCVIAEADSGLVVEKHIGNENGIPTIMRHLEAEEEYMEVQTA